MLPRHAHCVLSCFISKIENLRATPVVTTTSSELGAKVIDGLEAFFKSGLCEVLLQDL